MYWSAVTWRELHLFYLWQNLDLCFVELHLRVNTWLFFSGVICLKLLSSSYFLNLTHVYIETLCLSLSTTCGSECEHLNEWPMSTALSRTQCCKSVRMARLSLCQDQGNDKSFPWSKYVGWNCVQRNLCCLNDCGLTLISFRDLLWRHLTGLLVQQYIIRMQLPGCCCFFIRGRSYLFPDFLYMSVVSSFLMALVRSLPTLCMPGQPEKQLVWVNFLLFLVLLSLK